MSGPEVPRRVYLHVGMPTCDTAFLQAALTANRKALEEAGFLFSAGGGEKQMLRAALDVRGNHKAWGRKRSDVEGTWDRLCRKARRHEGTTVISHELLAAATPRQIASAQSMLTGLDVHVVVTARDLGRQLTAAWQDGVTHGRTADFETFRGRVMSDSREHEDAQQFWAAQDLPGVLSRWASRLPAENVHVVCHPPQSADATQLWCRFADVIGFDPDAFDPSGPPSASSSLGAVQIDLLRQVNAALDGRLVQQHYYGVVHQYFTKGLLAQHRSNGPELPLDLYDDLTAIGERWVKEIDSAGYTVHGDLTELIPTPPQQPGPHPDEVDRRAEATTAAAVVADLLVEVDRLQTEVAGLESDKKSAKKKRKLLKRRNSGCLPGECLPRGGDLHIERQVALDAGALEPVAAVEAEETGIVGVNHDHFPAPGVGDPDDRLQGLPEQLSADLGVDVLAQIDLHRELA